MFLNAQVFAQNRQIDSLLKLISVDKEDAIKVLHLNDLSYEYSLLSKHAQSIEISQEALKLSENIKYKTGALRALNSIGIEFKLVGNYPEALKNYYEGLKKSTTWLDEKGISVFNDNIGSVLLNQKKYPEALERFLLALEINKKVNNKRNISFSYRNLGELYNYMKLPEKSLTYYENAMLLIDSTMPQYDSDIANCYLGITGTSFSLKKYEQALKNCKLSLQHFEKLNNKSGMAICYNYFGQIYSAQKNTKEAELSLNKAIVLSNETKELETLADSYLFLTEIDSLKSDYQSAFRHYKQYSTYKDSLINETSIEKSMQVSMQYEFDKKQLANEFKAKQLQLKQDTRKNIIVIGVIGVALLLLLLLAYRHLKQKQRLEKKQLLLEKQLTENEINLLRLQINPHLIFNTLNSINAFITSKENTEAEKYLMNFSKLLRSTLNQTANVFISLQEELNTLTEYIELEQLRLNHSFNYSITIDATVNTSCKIPPLILQPFVENAILHGLKHKTDNDGLLTITVKEQNELFVFTITDNGIGRQQAGINKAQKTHKYESKGIAITTQRIELLKNTAALSGVIINDLTSDDGVALGTEVVISLPVMGWLLAWGEILYQEQKGILFI